MACGSPKRNAGSNPRPSPNLAFARDAWSEDMAVSEAVPEDGASPLSSLQPPSSPVGRSTTIAITITKSTLRDSNPSTPLTAREEKPSYFPIFPSVAGQQELQSPSSDTSLRSSTPPLTGEPPIPKHSSSPAKSSSPNMSPCHEPASARPKPRGKDGLKLSNLPRFHPTNFQSTCSSPSPTKQHHQKSQSSDVQKLLHMYQREFITNATMAMRTTTTNIRPDSPHLEPLGSPGPVTPLALEEGECYLTAGAPALNQGRLGPGRDDVVDHAERQPQRLAVVDGGR